MRNLAGIGAPGSAMAGAGNNVRRYVAIAAAGLADDDPTWALQGANMLTTVNKMVADAEHLPGDGPASERAFAVARAGIAAPRELRSDVARLL